LSLKTNNLIILGITGLWIVLILIPIFLPPEREVKLSQAVILPSLPPKERTAGEERVKSSPAARPDTIQDVLSRNPFSLPSGIRIVSGESTESTATPDEAVQESKLTVILRRENMAMAVINHQIVQSGDFINGEKVINIGRDSVTLLGQDGSRRTLKLYENLPSITGISLKEGGIQ
jgi:hypothetical protein